MKTKLKWLLGERKYINIFQLTFVTLDPHLFCELVYELVFISIDIIKYVSEHRLCIKRQINKTKKRPLEPSVARQEI